MGSGYHFNHFKQSPIVIGLVALLSLLWISFKTPDPLFFMADPDGGHQLAGANQILLFGEHPFIDFRSTYGPLVFYMSALGQLLSGGRIIGEILLLIIGYTIAYVLLFKLLWKASRRLEVALFFTALALFLIPRIYKYYIVLGPVLVLFLAWNYIEKPSKISLWLMAFAIAVTGLFRPDFGLYSAVCGIVTVASRPAPMRTVIAKRLLSLIGAIVACASPWLLWALFNNGLGNYFYDSLLGAPRHAAGLALPTVNLQLEGSLFSPENGKFLLLKFFWLQAILLTVFLIVRRKHFVEQAWRQIFSTSVLASLAMIQASHRADYSHLLQAIPISLVLCAWLVGLAIDQLRKNSNLQRFFAALGLSTLTAISVLLISLNWQINSSTQFNPSHLLDSFQVYSRSKESFLNEMEEKYPGNWYSATVQHIKTCTQPSQRILAIPFLTTLYYLSDRGFGSGQMLFAPGYFSTSNDQLRSIERMNQQEVAMTIEIPGYKYDNRDDRQIEQYIPLVAHYLRKNFVEIEQIKPVVISANRDLNMGISACLKRSH
jgi:hypothetical protein